MPKVISFCFITLFLATVSVTPAVNQDGIWYYVGCTIAGATCFFVTLYQDEKNPNRPSWKLRLACSLAASFLAFNLYPSVKDFELNLILIKFKPFPTIHVFIGLCSFFGISIFRELKTIGNFGFRKYLGKLGDQLKAISKEKK